MQLHNPLKNGNFSDIANLKFADRVVNGFSDCASHSSEKESKQAPEA